MLLGRRGPVGVAIRQCEGRRTLDRKHSRKDGDWKVTQPFLRFSSDPDHYERCVGYEPRTANSAVWCATKEPPNFLIMNHFLDQLHELDYGKNAGAPFEKMRWIGLKTRKSLCIFNGLNSIRKRFFLLTTLGQSSFRRFFPPKNLLPIGAVLPFNPWLSNHPLPHYTSMYVG